jgi:DNA sulfur modification protein DndD
VKLHSLRLDNFRQFYGTQQIEFAQGGAQKSVTVLHGFNGAGKTALLNAFVWCLYGETTPDFEEPDRLENERAAAELPPGKFMSVSVQLEYEVRGETFIVKRTRAVSKETPTSVRRSDDELSMWRIGTSGKMEEVQGGDAVLQLRIEQLLPRPLYPFFFFNGERVERLASADAYDDVERGVKTLLDVEVFERSLYHLRGMVLGELGKELKSVGDKELKEAVAEEEKLVAERDEQEAIATTALQNAKALASEIETLETRQSQIAALSQLSQRRTALRDQASEIEKENQALLGDLGRSLSDDGYLVFAEPVFSATEQLVAGARQRGEIPAKIKPQFVNDLLRAGKCICETPLVEGSPARTALVKWRESTGLAELEEAISQTSAMIPAMRQRREKFEQAVARIQTRRDTILATRKSVLENLATVEQQIGDRSVNEDAAELAALLAKRRQEHQVASVDVAVAEKAIRTIDERHVDLRARIKKLQGHDARSALVKRQRESVERVADAFEGIFQIQKETVRVNLDALIAEIWRDAAIKDYTASLGSDYRLKLTKRVGGNEQQVFGASTGEKQVLALSFVASLVRTAADHLKEDGRSKVLGVPMGGDYPLVMDSAFGSLEDEYRSKVAEWVPKLAHQVILLVSNSQWRVEVENAVKNRVGREYIFELHTSKQGADRAIVLNGKKYPYVVCVAEPLEFTVVKEVR